MQASFRQPFPLPRLLPLATATILICAPLKNHSLAVTMENKPMTSRDTLKKDIKKRDVSFVKDISLLKAGLAVQVSASARTLAIPDSDVKTRIMNPNKDPLIEPIQLAVPPEDDKILALAGKIARPGKKLALAHYLRENLAQGEVLPGTSTKLVNITAQSMEMVDQSELDQMFAKDHFKLTLSTKSIKSNAKLREQFLSQLEPYFSRKDLSKLRRKFQKGESVDVDTELLPTFAKEVVTHHTMFKGPNCFHAALSFQSPVLSQSPYVNVREEPGYHKDMVNYDELWRVIQANFYEVDTSKTDLQYGDMVVFFDIAKAPKTGVDFKTLRHASTYLFGGYAFAKGSKSANSPYLIRPLADEWSTWTNYTEELGVKVFRRNLKRVKNAALWDPQDWMY